MVRSRGGVRVSSGIGYGGYIGRSTGRVLIGGVVSCPAVQRSYSSEVGSVFTNIGQESISSQHSPPFFFNESLNRYFS